MAAAVYTVTITINPGVEYRMSKAEYEHVVEQGIFASLVAVTVPVDEVVITDGTEPASPALGVVWFNRSIP